MAKKRIDGDLIYDVILRFIAVSLVALVILGALAHLSLLFMVMDNGQRPPNCGLRMRQHYLGLRMYLKDYDDYLPMAWHVDGATLAGDLSNLTYYRFRISCERYSTFVDVVLPQDVARCGGDQWQACREKFAEVQ